MNFELLTPFVKQGLLCSGEEIYVAVSGGADSVALLHFLLHAPLNLTVSVLHFNHQIRGEEADRDERFVRKLCKSWGVPLSVGREDIPTRAKEEKKGIEETARDYRYAFFDSEAGGNVVATAHHADDLAETILMNLVRGTGLKGLAGIPPIRGRVIRPLLPVSRDEIIGYCQVNNLSFVEDSTNFDTSHSRNKIRAEVLPVLKELNPNLLQSFFRNTLVFREEDRYFEEQAKEIKEIVVSGNALNLEKLLEYDIAIARRVLMLFLKEHRISVSFERVERLLAGIPGSLDTEHTSQIKNGILTILPRTPKTKMIQPIEIKSFPKTLSFAGKEFVFSLLPYGEFEITVKNGKEVLKNSLDYDTIGGILSLRSRQAGDRIRLFERKVSKSVKKLLSEDGVPVPKRERLAVLSDGDALIWLEGYGPAERNRVTGDTKTVLVISYRG